MDDPLALLLLVVILLVSLALFALLAAVSSVLGLWLRATASGHPVQIMSLTALRLRGSPPNLILNAYIHLRRLEIPVTIFGVEAIYLANRKAVHGLEDLVQKVQEEWQRRGGAVEDEGGDGDGDGDETTDGHR